MNLVYIFLVIVGAVWLVLSAVVCLALANAAKDSTLMKNGLRAESPQKAVSDSVGEKIAA